MMPNWQRERCFGIWKIIWFESWEILEGYVVLCRWLFKNMVWLRWLKACIEHRNKRCITHLDLLTVVCWQIPTSNWWGLLCSQKHETALLCHFACPISPAERQKWELPKWCLIPEHGELWGCQSYTPPLRAPLRKELDLRIASSFLVYGWLEK